ncbi:hypothetical protein EFO98_03085 [Lactiplantibacillus argentoratensis]|uniref:Uncharacterized protein n=1 Tax=Lactiplantibacillus argentoratensis TaxID=271881 RepID=A0AAN1Q3T5_9LACO|nr:hypothetical protein LPA65_11085 [Lactiplantibacillus argentoratensis]MCT4442771.1 hypothetical protein [Lactiplantibacillus argentoratensis]MPQ37076.1 hypothetical protein [Lactiplantibacillus plantarum]MZU92228.1 hypothetical protein [Lactiplantibacillus plantarum]
MLKPMQTSLNIKVSRHRYKLFARLYPCGRHYNLNGRLCHELFKLVIDFDMLGSSLSLLNEFSIGKVEKSVKDKFCQILKFVVKTL